MKTSILNYDEYYRTVYGGWMGKNIGGTLGGPLEGEKRLLDLTYYPEVPDGPLENDDLDLQLVWLHALEQHGPKLNAAHLGKEWVDHVFFPFDEYGYALTNLRRGLVPPVSGWFGNPFTHCMGSPIRSEIWAMVAPGAPHVAAYFAYQDAIVDHAGGEGVYGEVFFATIQSAIFIEKDRDRLIALGLSSIPASCRTARALNDLLRWHREGRSWMEARELILTHHGDDNFTDAPQNVAFTILGWLYGKDFEDAILKATNCGYDTDCTAATLGAILGMIIGPDGLPDRWVSPIGDAVVVSPPIKGFPAPKNLDELTRRTIRMGKHVLATWDTGILVHEELPTQWNDVNPEGAITPVNAVLQTYDRRLLPEGSQTDAHLQVDIDYGEEGPAIGRNGRKSLAVTLKNLATIPVKGVLSLELPEGWSGPQGMDIKLDPGESRHIDVDLTSSNQVRPSYQLAIRWDREHVDNIWATERVAFTLVHAAEWTVWGPNSKEGKKILCPTNRIAWEQACGSGASGSARAATKLYNPRERVMWFNAASNRPITVKLDGKPIIHCSEIVEFMPAYHRTPEDQRAKITLPAGIHELELEVQTDGDIPEVYVIPVALREKEMVGPCYYFTDLLFGTEQ